MGVAPIASSLPSWHSISTNSTSIALYRNRTRQGGHTKGTRTQCIGQTYSATTTRTRLPQSLHLASAQSVMVVFADPQCGQGPSGLTLTTLRCSSS